MTTAKSRYSLVLDVQPRSNFTVQWRFEITDPNGKAAGQSGELQNVSLGNAKLFTLALAARSIPRGSELEISSVDGALAATAAKLLTKSNDVSLIPYAGGLVDGQRMAWQQVERAFDGLVVKWRTVAPYDLTAKGWR